MVKKRSSQNHSWLQAARTEAQQKTAAQIAVTLHPASDTYQDYILFYGLTCGVIATLYLWQLQLVVSFPYLLSILLAVVLLFDLIPFLRRGCIHLVPRKVKHARGARSAFNEFHARQSVLSPEHPFVLLYISLAERYVHIITSPEVHAQIPQGWHSVTAGFAENMRNKTLREACKRSLNHLAEILSEKFPA